MATDSNIKIIREIISLTPLIIDPKRDAPRFQEALAQLSTSKLQAFYRNLGIAEQQRFHYVANLCLGFDSWREIYKILVLKPTQERLIDRVEDLFARREEQLNQREAILEEQHLSVGTQIMHLEAENRALRRENQLLQEELATYRERCQQLAHQQTQLQELIHKYQTLVEDLRTLLAHPSLLAKP